MRGFEEIVLENMDFWGVPGTAVSILHKGEEVFARPFGFKDVGNQLPVTKDTLFPIGSVTKSFTAAAAAVLVDRGLLDWQTPLSTRIPDLKLFDEVSTERLTIIDLLAQRSGLPPHNNFWYGSHFNREELFQRIQYLEPAWDLRTRFCYTNLNYLIAGVVIEKISGVSWEEFIRQTLLDPLDMKRASQKKAGLTAAPDYALPYKQADGEYETFPVVNIEACAPAGSLNMNMTDFQKWALFNTSKGVVEGQRILSRESMDMIWQIHQANVDILPFSFKEIPYTSYGLGCYVMPYRGVKMILQAGNIEGYVAASFILPDEELCINIQANAHEANLYLVSTGLSLADRALGLSPINWNERCMEQLELFLSEDADVPSQQQAAREALRKPGTQPTHELEAFTGTYEHPGYGPLVVSLDHEGLVASHNTNREVLKYFHTGAFRLKHFHFNVFEAEIESLSGDYHGLVSFQVNKEGDVDSMAVPFEPLVHDIVFRKKAGRE